MRAQIKLAAVMIWAAASTLAATPPAWAEPRMSYEESSAIKCDMLGGHITGRDENGRYLCSAPRMAESELDHCQSLCLGGSNARSNLQLQPWHTPDGRDATHKDYDEIRLCAAVRAGKMSPEAARAELSRLWPCNARTP